MTHRTKLYLRNTKGRRVHCIIFQGLNAHEHERMAKQVNAMNEALHKGQAGPVVGIVVPAHATYQVVRL